MFKNKNVIITGTNRGLGKSIMEAFAREGANIFAHARKETEEFSQTINDLKRKYDVDINPVYFDLSDLDAIKSGFKQIYDKKVPIDILVNNAGMAFGGTLSMTPMNKLKEVFDVNYFAPVYLMQLAAKVMMRQKNGNIINIASVGGIETNAGYLAYGSGKAALIWATKSVSRELAQFNIRVNAVAPGLTRTSMGFYKNEEELNKVIERTSLKRMAEPEEIVNSILFLASEKSSFITGAVLNVDGGR